MKDILLWAINKVIDIPLAFSWKSISQKVNFKLYSKKEILWSCEKLEKGIFNIKLIFDAESHDHTKFLKIENFTFSGKKFESTNEKFISKRPGKMIHVTILWFWL